MIFLYVVYICIILLGDMVSDWLKMQDNVMMETGEPTWNSLVEALERIGQEKVAKSIKGTAITADIKFVNYIVGR